MQATLGQRPKSLSRHEAAIQPPQPDGAAEILRNPSTGGREWFHGTRASSAQLAGGFRTGEGDSDPWFPAHWSTGLGTHFAAHHGSADKFANPSIGVGGKGTAADPEHSHTPSVVHARLHIRNPKVYENEDRMADDVFEHEHGERKNYISRYLYGGDREGDKEVPYAAADYFSYDHHPDEAPARGEYENFDDYEDRAEEFGDEQPEPVYRREQWLNLHPDQAGIARRHRERLQAAGHDGIVYANNSPDERVRSKRPESHQVAIAFHPSQVEITKHHVFGDEHKTAAADDPWRITHDEDDTYHRLAAHDGDEEVGYLTWHKDHPPRYTGEPSTPGLVGEIEVHPDYYHRGIATALWQRAQKYDPAPIHSDHVTGPGSDWIKSLGAARWSPSSGVFGPTTGHDPKLFDGDELRPEVRRDVMERLDRALRVDTGLVGSDWQDWTKVYLAGGSASEWAGERPNDAARDLDILIGVSYHEARRGSGAFQDMDSSQIDTAFNSALRAAFNDPDWHPSFGGTWQLTGYVNPDAYDITKIKPYAAYNVTDMKWAVKPPHLPEHTLDDFDPAILAMARAMATEARAILRMPEPARTHEARALWERLHSDRRRAFSDEGEGWQDPGNLVEKYLAYAPGKLLERIKNLALAIPLTAAKTATLTLYRGEGDHDRPSYYPKTGPDANLTGAWWTSDLEKARGYAKKAGPSGRVYQVEVQPHEAEPHGLPGYYHIPDPKVRERRTLLTAAKTAASPWVFYHGTPDERTWQNSTKGIHVGTEEAARQALNARIGKPHEGEWDGTREYGKTLLSPYQHSGTERDLGEPKYPSGRASYADGTKIPMDARPSIFPVRIVGPMTNHPATPHQDWHANGYMSGQLKRGRAKSGYFYRNEGEDAGSISAVVPSAAHLERIEREPQQRTASVDPYDEETGEPRPWHRKWPGETEEDLTRRRGQYVQQVADAHHVSPAAAHRVIAQVAGDLDSDKAFTDGRKYGFASEPHGHRDVFSEQQIKHLMTPELWHGVPVTQVPTEGIHATQNWLRPRTLAHNLFHPGKKLGQVDDEEGHPDFDPDDLPREEEDYDDIDEGSRPRPDLGEHVRYMRREDGRMQLLDGHHRAAIDIALGKKTTPGTVIDEAKLRAAMRSPVHLHGEEMSAADLHTHMLQHHDRTRSELPEPRDANHLDLVDEHDHSHEFEAPGHEHQVLESAHQRGRIPAATIERYAAADTIYIPPPLPPEALEEAKRSPHKVASSYAQMAMWRDHPRVRMQFPQSHEGGDELVGHMLRHTGYEGDTEGAFVARHPDPSRGRSNAAYLNGKPGVALHPDRWDYGTVAHETAHHTVMYRHAIGPNEPQTDEQVHGPEWSAAYARGLNVISPGAGDAFLHHKQHYLEEIGARGKTAAAERRYMYHSTSPRHRDSIGQGGLRTEFSEDPGDWKSVYMSERPGDDPGQDVWRVDVTGYHPEVDGDSGEDRGVVGESYFLDHDVPPERMKLHKEGKAEGEEEDNYFTCAKGHEHWGKHGAAGLLIRHRGEDGLYRYLLQKRSDEDVDHPGVWSNPSGAVGEHETPEEGAKREYREEHGPLPRGVTHHHTVCSTDCGDWQYHTVIMDSPERFHPRGGGETGFEQQGHAWLTAAEIRGMANRGELHPAFAKGWDKVRTSRPTVARATETHATADYRQADSPKRRCGGCVMFREGVQHDWCTKVKGVIEEDHVCRFFYAKGKTAAADDSAVIDRPDLSSQVGPHEAGYREVPTEQTWEARRQRVNAWLDKQGEIFHLPSKWGPHTSNQVAHGLISEHDGPERDEHWEHLPDQEVSLRQPVHTHQGFVYTDTVRHYLNADADPDSYYESGEYTPGGDEPKFVRHQGTTYMLDGHHRYAKDRLMGHESMYGKVFDTSNPEHKQANCYECHQDEADQDYDHDSADCPTCKQHGWHV